MKIIGINGSPHEEGNTTFLLNKALDVMKGKDVETQILHIKKPLAELDSPFCVHCSSPCNQSCYQGTLLAEYFDLMAETDGIILASPVYFGTVSAQLKSFWDMTRALRTEEALFNTVGGAIAVGGSRFGGQETTIRALQDMMLVQGMTIIGDGAQGESVGHQGACGQQEAAEDETAQQEAENLGQRIFQVANKLNT